MGRDSPAARTGPSRGICKFVEEGVRSGCGTSAFSAEVGIQCGAHNKEISEVRITASFKDGYRLESYSII
jgi:hypothetical protein